MLKGSYVGDCFTMCAFNLEIYTDMCWQQVENASCAESQHWLFQAKSHVIRNSSKTTCKEEKNRICETAMMYAHSTKIVESLFQFGSLETHFSEAKLEHFRLTVCICCIGKHIILNTKRKLSRRWLHSVCIQLREWHWCVYAAVCKPFLRRFSKLTFSSKIPYCTK